MRIIEDGIHTDISIEEYHENQTHVSATTLKYAKQSLRHFDWYRKGKLPREDKSCFGFGNAFELALLDPTGYTSKVAIFPDGELIDKAKAEKPDLKSPRASKVYQEGEREFLAANKGKYIIQDTGNESFDVIEEMLSSCYQDKAIQALIKNTEYQLSLFWTDEETGIKLKTRPDICKRKKNVIVNLKTTIDGSPEAFSKEMNKWDYPLQACVEITGCLRSGLMDEVDKYFWLVVEKVAPFNATIYEFTQEDIGSVMDGFHYLLSKLAKAEKANVYPGYTQEASNEFGILEARVPLWYRR